MISVIGRNTVLSSIPINLIRQWCYCPRKVYYFELTEFKVMYPTWISQGEDFHKLEEQLWQRRNLSRFGLKEGKIYHNLAVKSKNRLGMHGIVDMAIETNESVYAIEFKISASNKKRGDQLQLVAYAMLLEERFSKPSNVGFLIGKGKILHTINIDQEKRTAVMEILDEINKMLIRGSKPDSDASIYQCCSCEYVNFCNDRL